MRTLAALLLLGAVAFAGEVVVRVTIDEEPADGVVVALAKGDIVFDRTAVNAVARTDETGQAVVKVKAGDKLLVYRPGFALAVADADSDTIDVALRPERIVEGVVRDKKGQPVPDAAVTLGTYTKRRATFVTRTDAKGRFYVYGLWFDTYIVDVKQDGFVPWHDRVDRDRVEVSLKRFASLRGKLVDLEGKPVAGVDVRFGPGGERRTKSDADGAFRFDELVPDAGEDTPEWMRSLRSGLWLYAPWVGQLDVAPLADGEERVVPAWRIARPVTLRVRVVDGEGNPRAGVTARATNGADRDVASGEDGVLTVSVRSGEVGTLTLAGPKLVAVETELRAWGGGASIDLGDQIMRALPRIEVRVRGPDGKLVAEGTIAEQPLKDGTAVVEGEGSKYLKVPGYADAMIWVSAPGPVEHVLPEPFWLTGRVLTADGRPAAGATVGEATADEDGRFRLGPLPRAETTLYVRHRGAERMVTVIPSEGELLVRLPRSEPDLLRGRVLRDGRPVTRFAIDEEAFADEQGRFELLVDRAALRYVRVEVDERRYHFALPEPGRELVARLPTGSADVIAAPGVWVLLDSGGVRADESGVARFDGLPRGRHTARADGFADKDFVIDDGATPPVRLERIEKGTLITVPPPGKGETLRRDYRPGVAEGVTVCPGVALERIEIRPGEQTVDLAAGDAGALSVRGAANMWVEVRRTTATYTVIYADHARGGECTFPHLPSGTYEVTVHGARRSVEVVGGRTALVHFDTPRVTVTGRVVHADGSPVQGAKVSWGDGSQTSDLGGRFRFERMAPGLHRFRAEGFGMSPVEVEVEIAAEDTTVEIEMRPEIARGRLLGAFGEPLAKVPLRVAGAWTKTDALGGFGLPRERAPVDLDLRGYASLRGEPGGEIRLQRGASLVIRTDLPRERLTLRVAGEPFRRLDGSRVFEPGDGGFVIDDLPPGPAEIVVAPAEEGEDPRVVRVRLRAGVETRIELASE